MFDLTQISKRFGDTIALQPTDFHLKSGETVALIGPSGSGKSTLLRLLAGLVRPDSGTLRFEGQDIADGDWIQVRRQIGYVIQDGGLFPHLSAQDNVTLMARYLKWDAAHIDARVQELAGLVQLETEQLQRFPNQLSGGQRQRVSIMRALMLDPKVMLFDEPLSALDPITRYDLALELRDIFKSLKKAVVLVTHALNEARFFGDRVILMGDGRIVQQGHIEEFENTPANDFVARFLQSEKELG
ncbi:MAG: ATP-binding cassette domain-containing protein [Sphingomonadales bacterium]|jgi:osmoprotectant transport system ATP-binding protein